MSSSSWSTAIAEAQEGHVKDADPVVYHPYMCQNVQVGIKGELAELKQDGKHCYVALPDQTPFALVFHNTGRTTVCVNSKIGNKTNGSFIVHPLQTSVIKRPHDVDRPFVFFEDGNSKEAKAAFVDNDEPDKDLVEFQLFMSKHPTPTHIWVPKSRGFGSSDTTQDPCFGSSDSTRDPPVYRGMNDVFFGAASSSSEQEKSLGFDQSSNGAVGLGATATNQRFKTVDFECQDRPAFTWYIRLIPRVRATSIPPKWRT